MKDGQKPRDADGKLKAPEVGFSPKRNADGKPVTDSPSVDSAFENYWYHYKWPTLAGIFVVIFLIIAFAQMAGRKGYDVHVLYTGPLFLDKEVCLDAAAAISDAADAAMPLAGGNNPADYNGDGVITVDFNKYVYVPTELAQQYRDSNIYFNGLDNANARGDFDNALVIGEYVILLLDRSLYEETVGVGAYCTWEETVGSAPEKALDDCGILLSDLPIGQCNGFRQLPDDTVLCCRKTSYINALNKKVQNAEMYQAEVALFCQMVEYQG